MNKKIIIDSCGGCPHRSSRGFDEFCKLTSKYPQGISFPDWCPLDNAENEMLVIKDERVDQAIGRGIRGEDANKVHLVREALGCSMLDAKLIVDIINTPAFTHAFLNTGESDMESDKKWCPMTRVSISHKDESAVNRHSSGVIPNSCKCIEEACGLWNVRQKRCGIIVAPTKYRPV